MKIKIISLLLCLALIFPTVALFVSADDTVLEYDDYESYSELFQVKQSSTNESYCAGFERFIDVEKYISNAGQANFNTITLVGLWEKYFDKDIDFIYLFLYNPMKLTFIYGEETYGYANVASESSGGTYSVDFMRTDSYNDDNSMFMVVELAIPREMRSELNYDQRVYYMLQGHLITDVVEYDEDSGLNIYSYSDFSINTAYSFTGFNQNKQVSRGIFDYLKYSNPVDDLVRLTGYNRPDIMESYPIDGHAEPSVVFFYEEDYGTEDYALYLYLYNPRLLDYKRLSVFMYHNNMFTGEMFDLVNSDGALYKYRMKYPSLLGMGEDRTVREYFISGIYTYNSAMKFTDALSFEAYFMYSSVDTANVVQTRFEYDFSDLMIDAPESAGNGTYTFTKGEKYLLTFESSKLVEYTVTPLEGFFRVSDQGEGWVELEILKNVSMLEFEEFSGFSLFPYTKTPEVNFTFTKISDSDPVTGTETGTTSGGASSTGSHIANRLNTHPVVVMFDDVTVDKDAVYLKANIDEEINVNGYYTYYRLDSSATAVNNYQTLSTLYFALPNKYLEAENEPIYDRYVSAIELAYSSAMCQPIIVGNNCNSEVVKYMVKMGYGTGEIDHQTFLGSGMQVTELGLNYFLDFDIMFHAELFPPMITGQYSYDTLYTSVPYWVYVSEDWDEFDEVLSTEEVTKIIQSKMFFESDLKDSQYVLNFDDTKTLSSFKDMTWENLVDSFGLLRAIQYKLFGTDQEIMDSIENIKCIETLTGADITKALSLDDATFSDTYYVALSDVPNVKAQMQSALAQNESFVFVRFDVFDYYASNLYGFDDMVNDPEDITDFDGDMFVFQTKYYQGLEVLSLATTNSFSTKIYNVTMPPIDTSGGGATSPDPIDPGQFNRPLKDVPNWDWLFILLSLVLIIPAVILIVIFIKWIFKPVKSSSHKRE